MLQIYHTYFNSDSAELLYDSYTNRYYSLIQKCGTRSLVDLSVTNPDRYKIVKFKEVSDRAKKIIVHLREPVYRFYSGIETQCRVYGINKATLIDAINSTGRVVTIDSHTAPQFWSLLRFAQFTGLKFKFLPLSNLSQVDPEIKQLNHNKEIKIEFNDIINQKINHFLTEDIVLYNQFMYRTVELTDIIDAIKKETTFIDNIKQYCYLPDYY